ncbi:complexin-4-like [Tiliqua scincoides]|uniref:complexin-4-like n=1 Tax=Tiliqua scincoides TaxID=71010 RepID=UPI0034618027
MESTAKSIFGAPARQLLCCISADFPKEKEISIPRCPNQGRGQQPSQKQTSKRDLAFVRQKAERAAMRAHLREKYQLPKNRIDKKQLEATGGEIKLPQDLLAIMKSTGPSAPGSIFTNLGNLDFSSLRMTAGNAVQALQRPVQCPVM